MAFSEVEKTTVFSGMGLSLAAEAAPLLPLLPLEAAPPVEPVDPVVPVGLAQPNSMAATKTSASRMTSFLFIFSYPLLFLDLA
jgi:hypothetical protein